MVKIGLDAKTHIIAGSSDDVLFALLVTRSAHPQPLLPHGLFLLRSLPLHHPPPSSPCTLTITRYPRPPPYLTTLIRLVLYDSACFRVSPSPVLRGLPVSKPLPLAHPPPPSLTRASLPLPPASAPPCQMIPFSLFRMFRLGKNLTAVLQPERIWTR